ncbi:hypothetical protein C8Q80DRAFT_1267769 [Daedaleopsis nitida]|nr:hypothetical protein C8Q80DRAFT_1267769 [Daedaleopsis nitida]
MSNRALEVQIKKCRVSYKATPGLQLATFGDIFIYRQSGISPFFTLPPFLTFSTSIPSRHLFSSATMGNGHSSWTHSHGLFSVRPSSVPDFPTVRDDAVNAHADPMRNADEHQREEQETMGSIGHSHMNGGESPADRAPHPHRPQLHMGLDLHLPLHTSRRPSLVEEGDSTTPTTPVTPRTMRRATRRGSHFSSGHEDEEDEAGGEHQSKEHMHRVIDDAILDAASHLFPHEEPMSQEFFEGEEHRSGGRRAHGGGSH